MIETANEVDVILALIRAESVRWVYNRSGVFITFSEDDDAPPVEIDDNGVMYTPDERPYMATSQQAMRVLRTAEAVGQALACVPRGNLAAMGGERGLAEAYHKVSLAEEYVDRHARDHNIAG